jgi:Ca2+-transporting ATPase
VLILLLIAATTISALLGEWINAAAIGVTVVVSAGFGFLSEYRSERTIAALRSLTALRAEVVRGGQHDDIPASDVVPGDLLVVSEGDSVPADARIAVSRGLIVNEAIITGESVPAEKQSDSAGIVGATSPALIFAGTTIHAGSARAVVICTGRATVLGEIATGAEPGHRRATPMEARLERLGTRLVVVFIATCVAVIVAGIGAGRETTTMVEMGVSLAIGAVPEGLPAVATAALAVAVRRLARLTVLVRRLDAVETLGSTTLIVSDKTGTLTENRIAVRTVLLPDGRAVPITISQPDVAGVTTTIDAEGSDIAAVREVLLAGALCNDATLQYDEDLGWRVHGDPLEGALLLAAMGIGLDSVVVEANYPRVETIAFTAARRMMETVHRGPDGEVLAMKGGFEQVAERAGNPAPSLRAQVEAHGLAGYRILAIAMARRPEPLRLIGAVVLEDPIRADAREAVEACRQAGVRLVLATGDHLDTAATVARDVGLLDDGGRAVTADRLGEAGLGRVAVIARATHSQKEEIVDAYQAQGEVVAMLGDGVNDAPALRSADVGVAVGSGATDVAVEAAHVAIADGRLLSLVAGIKEGRQAARGLRQAIVYLLTASFATIVFIAASMPLDNSLPLAPLQILWLNIVVHVFPALALATGRDADDPMTQPTTALVAGHTWAEISVRASTAAAGTWALLVFAISRDESLEVRQTLAFVGLAAMLVGQVFLIGVRHPRDQGKRLRRPGVWAAVFTSAALMIVALVVPGLTAVLDTTGLSLEWWITISVVAAITLNVAQIATVLLRRFLAKQAREDQFT